MNSAEGLSQLHIPEGINYECTGCGKCCGGWAIPMTHEDYQRISAVNWGDLMDKFKGKSLFRPLKDYEKQGTPYTHAIKPTEEGPCPFLVDNLCFIHSRNGALAKPSICQLFPYCFNETPSGIYATVSFVSMGVIHNSGKPLSDQRDFLEDKLKQFQALFPDHHPNWSQLKLTVGQPLSWQEYLEIEKHLLDLLKDKSISLDDRFIAASKYLTEKASSARSADVTPSSAQLNNIDLNLLVALHKVYFPSKPTGKGEGEFSSLGFISQALSAPMFSGLKFQLPGKSYKIEELVAVPWPEQDVEIDDLLWRYFFSRIFGKLYFGAGFGQLSLIVGFHHLAILLALVKLQARALALSRSAPGVSLLDAAAAVRQLEKRIGEVSVGNYAAALLELLLFSHRRLKRILDNCR